MSSQTDSAQANAPMVKVWDPVVRIFHWSLVICFATAWLTADEWRKVHELSGYVAGGLLAVRIVWGLVGPRHARFSDFVRGPRTVLGYLGDIVRGRERRHLGHNPAGGAMVVALIAGVSAQVVLGWLSTTDAFFGVEWVEEAHEALAWWLLSMIALHILGVAVASFRHAENLPLAMLTGRKRSQ